MSRLSRFGSFTLVASAIALVHCGGSTNLGTPGAGLDGGTGGDGGLPILGEPLHHFPGATSCRTPRPPGLTTGGDAGLQDCDGGVGLCRCDSDSECTQGNNGRCTSESNAGPHCTYDQCSTSTDCASGKSCGCGDINAESANLCVPSNCRVDNDCGAGGFCSPSVDPTCGTFGGEYVGIYCHTPQDECHNDSDCTAQSNGPSGFCAFNPDSAKWACSYGFCAG